MKKILRLTTTLIVLLFLGGNAWGQYSGAGTFTKITSMDDLTDGYYVIVNSGDAYAMNSTNAGSYFTHTAVTPVSGVLTNPATDIVWKIETNGGGRSIYNEVTQKYVSYTGSSNAAYAVDAVNSDSQRWTFSYASNLFNVANLALTTRVLQYNASSPRFACYTSAQQKLLLYKMGSAPTDPTITVGSLTGFGNQQINTTSSEKTYDVSGSNLTANIAITPPAGFLISTTSGSGYASTPITLTQSGGTVSSTPIYVVFNPTLAQAYSDNITHESSGATTMNVAVSGTGTNPPPPDAPVATSATAVTTTGFTANWDASSGATGYYLDVYHTGGSSVATDLIISEYIEGSSNNKAIELYNGTGGSVDLANYSLKKQVNGAGAFQDELTLSGTFANNETYVIVKNDAGATLLALADLTSNSACMSFNGNDAVALYKSGVQIDVVGIVDQVSDWGKDVTLVRKSSVTSPTISYSISDWDSYAVDTFTYLGSHTMGSGAVYDLTNESVGNVTTYAVTTLSPGTTYFYVVRATNAYGTSANSNEIEVTTTGGGNQNPVISNIVQTPSSGITPATTVSVSADVTDPDGTIAGVELHWGTISGILSNNIDMSLSSGSTYTTDSNIPAQAGGTTVYYEIYALDDDAAATTSPEQSYQVESAEPSAHPTGFGATANSSSEITVSWTDAIPAADGYLIKGSDVSYGNIAAPADGTPETNGLLVQNVASGVQTFQFTGLAASTTYYFKIYPYNGSAAAINYKTDGAVPQVEATTTGGVLSEPLATAATAITSTGFTANWNAVAGATGYSLDVYTKTAGANATDLFISEYGEGSGGNKKYVEIFNGTGAVVDLADYVIKKAVNGGGWNATVYNFPSSTNLANNSTFVLANNETDVIGADAYDGFCTWNGNDAIGLFKNDVLIDVFGTPDINPGTGWEIAGVANASVDHILIRKPTVNSPSTDWSVSAGTTAENSQWEVSSFTYDNTNQTTNLGSHTMTGGSTQVFVSGYEDLEVGNVAFYNVTGLTPTTTNYYVVRATSAAGTSGNSNEIEVTTRTTKITTEAGEWSSIVWNPAGTPTAADDVTIGHAVTISQTGTANCHDLTIGTGSLIILSDASGTGSLITLGNATGNVSVQRYISGAAEAWHLLSSPVDAQSISGDFTPSGTYGDGTGYDFYAWDEPTETWLNQKVGAHNITAFVPAQGYLVAYQATNPTKTFTGSLNEGVYYSTLTASGAQTYQHSNLLGNPYPSSIDWKSVSGLDKSDLVVDGGGYNMYIWNIASVNYGVYNDASIGDDGTNGTSRYIAPMQGFYVVAANAGSFGFDNDARVHSTQAWLKSGNDNAFRLSVTAPANAGKDEILLDFGHEASQGGADKWYSMNVLAPALYVPTGEKDYSIRFLTSIADNPLVPVAFNAGVDGEYSIQAGFNPTAFPSVKLIDHLTGTIHDLNSNPTYNFTATTGDDANRFELKFGAVGIDDNIAMEQTSIYSHGRLVYISSTKSANALINIYNVTGQQVYANTMVIDGQKQIALSSPTGWYIVKVRTQEGVATQKVFIKSN